MMTAINSTEARIIFISFVTASGCASMLTHAIELPDRVGLVSGVFYGLDFDLGGIVAAAVGAVADGIGIESVYRLCSFLPLAGLLAWFLPRIEDHALERAAARAADAGAVA